MTLKILLPSLYLCHTFSILVRSSLYALELLLLVPTWVARFYHPDV